MKKYIKLVVAALVALTIVGCGGVDEDRLAELTGSKNFEQVKMSYAMALIQEKKDDLEIYAYWLDEYEDNDASFNFERFEKKAQMEYKEMITKLKKKMEEIKTNKDKYRVRQLQNERRMMNMTMSNFKFVKEVYAPFLTATIKEKLDKK